MRDFLPIALAILYIVGAALQAEDTTDFDKMPRKVIALPNHTTIELVTRNGSDYRIVDPSALPQNLEDNATICFVAQFAIALKPGSVKLLDCSLAIRVDDAKLFSSLSLMKPGDFVAFFGQVKKSNVGRAIDFNATEALKQRPEVERFAGMLAEIDNEAGAGDLNGDARRRVAQRYIQLGEAISQIINKRVLSFTQSDRLRQTMVSAIDKGLKLTEQTLRPEDADGWFSLGEQWFRLTGRGGKQGEYVLKTLRIDPEHAAASRIAARFNLQKFEGKWYASEEYEELKKVRQAGDENDRANLQEKLRELEKQREAQAVVRRESLLNFEAALRDKDPDKRRETLVSLGNAIQTAADSVYAQRLIDILTNERDDAVLASLDAARKSALPAVRLQVMEALAWRSGAGIQPEAALVRLSEAIATENDIAAARAGAGELVEIGNKAAQGALIAALRNPDSEVRSEIISSLQKATKQAFTTKDEWEAWWASNKP